MSDARAHIPVMLDDVLAALEPQQSQTIVDATFGAGGYTTAFLDAGANVIAFDRDPTAISAGKELVQASDGRLRLIHANFSDIAVHLKEPVDAIVADIGVSSMQIDQEDRGFSFQKDGPLDMRMSREGPTAADVVNHAKRADLTRIIGILGDERQASRISAEICAVRESAPITRTLELASLVGRVLGRKQADRIHPATRTFQALRIFVNGELTELGDLLLASEDLLKPGGRLAIVSFHSLEDRIVKRFFADRSGMASGSRHLPMVEEKHATFLTPKRGAKAARADEAAINPRARSAKLRVGHRTDAKSYEKDPGLFGLPRLPDPGEMPMKERHL